MKQPTNDLQNLSVRVPTSGKQILLEYADNNHQRLSDAHRHLLIEGLLAEEVNFDEDDIWPSNQ